MLTYRLPFALLLSVYLAACGGSSSSGGSNGGQMSGGGVPNWPQPDGGTAPERPPSVRTGRVIFRSASGEMCCVAVDPDTLTGRTANGQSLLVLDNLPAGPATVTVAAFATDFAPAVEGITETCATLPPEVGQVCDPTRIATPVFESDPLQVVIQEGTQIQIADLVIRALPFLVDFSPGQDEVVNNRVHFVFTMADAVNGVNGNSIALTVTVTVDAPGETPPFRSLTKRVPLTLTPCNDASDPTCSQGGDLGVKGFQAEGTAPKLPPGPADVHIVGQNLDTPPGAVDLSYTIEVNPGDNPPTPTADTPTPTASAVAASDTAQGSARQPRSNSTPAPPSAVMATGDLSASGLSAGGPSAETNLATHSSGGGPVSLLGATPTPTP
jgi:hypothetical protein